ncbi:MAG: hypothetical protein IPI41_15695 [Flavobacteriales bacterium]|nr:hypothetical protein [Flavobacteriales bacterium]
MNDHGQLREALHRCLSAGLTFAAFRRPDQPVEIWAQRTPDLEFIDGALMLELNEAFLIAPFELRPTACRSSAPTWNSDSGNWDRTSIC